MKHLWALFITFFRIGGLTFGGGLAMLPMLRREVVEDRKWATEEELLNYYSVGQCTPGIIAVNTATFIGYKQRGILGAIVATMGVVAPSVIIITAIASFLTNFTDLAVVQYAFAGIRVAVAALVVSAVVNLWKSGVKDLFGVILFIVAFIASAFLNLSPVYVVAAGIIVGILANLKRIKQASTAKEDK